MDRADRDRSVRAGRPQEEADRDEHMTEAIALGDGLHDLIYV